MTFIFDLESHSATERYSRTSDDFYRIGGASSAGTYRYTTDAHTMRSAILASPLVEGHNVIGFDLPALGVDVLEMASQRRVLDTMILDSVLDPPDFGMKPEQAMKQKYALEKACERYGVTGKNGDLKSLAKEFGGFGEIPTDDPRYQSYLRGDLDATGALLDALLQKMLPGEVSEYAWREMRVAALASTMSTTGFGVDVELLTERADAGERRQAELIKWLVETYDIPTTRPDGSTAKAPHATKAGKAALLEAFASVGVPPEGLPVTPSGAPSFAGDGLAGVADRFPEARELCEAIAALVGVRSVYATALRYLHPDGRVHPDVTMFQASGRWSITKPGLTVFGKRGGRKVERDVFVAAPGYVLMSADLSQVDARAVAAHSGDEEYIALFAPGLDSHEMIGRMVWGDAEYERDAKAYRDRVKAITHGTTYGMGVPKLALSAGVSEDEAQRVVSTLRERFPRLEVWKSEVREQAEAGELLDNGFGKMMRPNPQRAYTQGPALIGQGTARDVLMQALAIRLELDVQRMIRAVVHDEVIVECREEDATDVAHELEVAMNFEWCPAWMSHEVAFTAECSAPARRWSGCY